MVVDGFEPERADFGVRPGLLCDACATKKMAGSISASPASASSQQTRSQNYSTRRRRRTTHLVAPVSVRDDSENVTVRDDDDVFLVRVSLVPQPPPDPPRAFLTPVRVEQPSL